MVLHIQHGYMFTQTEQQTKATPAEGQESLCRWTRGGKVHTIDNDSVPSGVLCSSYWAEQTGLKKAAERVMKGVREGWLQVEVGKAIRFLTDSQSSIKRLAEGAAAQKTVMGAAIWSALLELQELTSCDIEVQFVPGHAGIEGNEKADEMAGQGSRLTQEGVSIDLDTAKAAVHRKSRDEWRRELLDPQPERGRGGRQEGEGEESDGESAVSNSESEAEANSDGANRTTYTSSLEVYRRMAREAAKGKAAAFQGLPGSTPGQIRRQKTILSQMRAGKCTLMRGYLHKVRRGRNRPEGHCEECAKYNPSNPKVEETVEHFMSCEHRKFRRLAIFEKLNIGLEILFTDPVGVLKYLNEEGRLDIPTQPGDATAPP